MVFECFAYKGSIVRHGASLCEGHCSRNPAKAAGMEGEPASRVDPGKGAGRTQLNVDPISDFTAALKGSDGPADSFLASPWERRLPKPAQKHWPSLED